MSRWLQSVNTLLENLDGQVSTAVQEAAAEQQQQQGSHSRAVQSVLERRGLVLQADDDDDDEGVSSSRGSSRDDDDGSDEEDGSYDDPEHESSWDQDEWDNDDEEESYSGEESSPEGEEYNDEDDDEEVIELLPNNDNGNHGNDEEEATATTNRTNAPLFRDDSSVNEEEEEAAVLSSVPAAGMTTERSIVDASHDTIPPPESPNEVPGLDHEKTTAASPAPTTMIVDPPSPSKTCDDISMPPPTTTKTTATETTVTTVSDVLENNSHTTTMLAAATMVVEPKQQTEAPAAMLLTTATSQESDATTKSHVAPPLSGNHSVQSISSSVANNNNNNTVVVGQASQGGVVDQQQQQLWVKKEHKWNKEAKKVQGEVRTLRGHVLKLNEQLEAAETELTAQRQELVRAAERMEKDRTRHRDQTDEMADDHDEELEAQKAEDTSLLQECKERHHQQLTELRDRLALVEERKAREDGNWTKELEEAVARERDAIQHKTELQNENAEWESKWNQAMQREAALNRKLENETIRGQTAEERERDAQDKLDASLSIHARQLSQKQARESELERTVADLGGALVVARQRELDRIANHNTNNQRRRRRRPSSSSQQHSNKQSNNDYDNENENDDTEYGDGEEDGMSIRERCVAAEEQVETLEAQLTLEVQRSETLNQELQDMSKEQAQEAVFAQERQRKHDQQVQDLQSTVTRLQATVRDLQKRSSNEEMNDHPTDGSANSDSGTGDNMATSKEQERLRKQVKTLSEQIVRQQGKLDNGNCEALALRSRLKTSLSRAETAEKALVTASSTRDVEQGSSSSNQHRSRYKGGGRASTRTTTLVQSIRSVLPSQFVNQHEAVGETMDALDSFAIDMGAIMRQNPLARGGFLLYLLILHVWTFCLLLFHTGETPCYDTLPHGPDALFQHHSSYRHLEQVRGNPTP
eukprot:scaffold117077_cov65-Attheya_sp.AAC.1